MWPKRSAEHQRLVTELNAARLALGLAGLPDAESVDTLASQFVASQRREDYYRLVQAKAVSAERADPNHGSFDAERAVAFHMQRDDVEEAGWLVFLMTQFARPSDSGWRRLQDVYGMLGAGTWTWDAVKADTPAFHQWVADNWQQVRGKFGNHRKYASLRPDADRPMWRTIDDYIAWIGPDGHRAFFNRAVREAGNDPHTIFDHLYRNMRVDSFGRLAKFDYLSLVGRYGLAPIVAGSAYLSGATGPGSGARLLIDGERKSGRTNLSAEQKLVEVDAFLKVGMTIMEDALCNWQKSPRSFIHYTG